MISRLQFIPITRARQVFRANTQTAQNSPRTTGDTVQFGAQNRRAMMISEFMGLKNNDIGAYIFTNYNAARGRIIPQRADVTRLYHDCAGKANSCSKETAKLFQKILEGKEITTPRANKNLTDHELQSLGKFLPAHNLEVIQGIFAGVGRETIDPKIALEQVQNTRQKEDSESLRAVASHLENIARKKGG